MQKVENGTVSLSARLDAKELATIVQFCRLRGEYAVKVSTILNTLVHEKCEEIAASGEVPVVESLDTAISVLQSTGVLLGGRRMVQALRSATKEEKPQADLGEFGNEILKKAVEQLTAGGKHGQED
jgi:hypothetical protein